MGLCASKPRTGGTEYQKSDDSERAESESSAAGSLARWLVARPRTIWRICQRGRVTRQGRWRIQSGIRPLQIHILSWPPMRTPSSGQQVAMG